MPRLIPVLREFLQFVTIAALAVIMSCSASAMEWKLVTDRHDLWFHYGATLVIMLFGLQY